MNKDNNEKKHQPLTPTSANDESTAMVDDGQGIRSYSPSRIVALLRGSEQEQPLLSEDHLAPLDAETGERERPDAIENEARRRIVTSRTWPLRPEDRPNTINVTLSSNRVITITQYRITNYIETLQQIRRKLERRQQLEDKSDAIFSQIENMGAWTAFWFIVFYNTFYQGPEAIWVNLGVCVGVATLPMLCPIIPRYLIKCCTQLTNYEKEVLEELYINHGSPTDHLTLQVITAITTLERARTNSQNIPSLPSPRSQISLFTSSNDPHPPSLTTIPEAPEPGTKNTQQSLFTDLATFTPHDPSQSFSRS
jgi:hypothetical protein